MIDYILNNPATVAAVMSAVATIMAVVATVMGPRSAAKLAERMRQNSQQENERRQMKLVVFTTLMQERANIASVDSVKMLNSIDIVFSDCRTVREAWAELFSILNTEDGPHPQLRGDKLRALLREMANDLGLSDDLRVDDIGRIYFPNVLAVEEELRLLEQQRALLQFRGEAQPAQVSAIDAQNLKKFPPKPLIKQDDTQ